MRAIGSELLWQGVPALFRVQQVELGFPLFAYQMLLIEQGAMQRKRCLVEKGPAGVCAQVDEHKRCQCLQTRSWCTYIKVKTH